MCDYSTSFQVVHPHPFLSCSRMSRDDWSGLPACLVVTSGTQRGRLFFQAVVHAGFSFIVFCFPSSACQIFTLQVNDIVRLMVIIPYAY